MSVLFVAVSVWGVTVAPAFASTIVNTDRSNRLSQKNRKESEYTQPTPAQHVQEEAVWQTEGAQEEEQERGVSARESTKEPAPDRKDAAHEDTPIQQEPVSPAPPSIEPPAGHHVDETALPKEKRDPLPPPREPMPATPSATSGDPFFAGGHKTRGFTPMAYTPSAKMKTPYDNPEKQAKIKALMKDIKAEKDKIYNVVSYFPKRRVADPITLYPIVKVDKDHQTVRLEFVACYSDSHVSTSVPMFSMSSGSAQWINFDTVSVRADDRVSVVKYDITKSIRNAVVNPSFATWLVAAASSTIMEQYVEEMDQDAFMAFASIAHAEEVTIRFSGKEYECTDKMGKRCQRATKQLYELYQILLQ